MKTIYALFIATLLQSFSSNAQITKGNWMVGGYGNLISGNDKDSAGNEVKGSSFTYLSIAPNIGYFITDKFAFGLSPIFTYNKNHANSTSSSGFGGGPFVRYYFLKPEKLINFLIEVNYNYFLNSKNSNFGNNYEIKTGPAIYFNNSVALELLAKYQHSFSGEYKTTSDRLVFGLGFQIHLENKH